MYDSQRAEGMTPVPKSSPPLLPLTYRSQRKGMPLLPLLAVPVLSQGTRNTVGACVNGLEQQGACCRRSCSQWRSKADRRQCHQLVLAWRG
jgi:hypothetical protein